MNVHCVTVSFATNQVLRHGLGKLTSSELGRWQIGRRVVLDNRYPNPQPKLVSEIVREASDSVEGCLPWETITAPYNLGGSEGFNFACDFINPAEEDLILGFDPDSNPVKKNWVLAMIVALLDRPDLAYVGLMPSYIADRYKPDTKGLVVPESADKLGVAMWRASFLKQAGGLKARHELYGEVEGPMLKRARELGMNMAYLYHYQEGPCPIPHDPAYTRWKAEYGSGKIKTKF